MSFKRPLSSFQRRISVIGRCTVQITLHWAALNFPLLAVPQLCGAAVIQEGSRVRVMSDHTSSITVDPRTIRLEVGLSGSLRNALRIFTFEALVSIFVKLGSDCRLEISVLNLQRLLFYQKALAWLFGGWLC